MAAPAVSSVSQIAPICTEVTGGEIRTNRNSIDCDPNHKIPLIRYQAYRHLEPQTLLINIDMIYSSGVGNTYSVYRTAYLPLGMTSLIIACFSRCKTFKWIAYFSFYNFYWIEFFVYDFMHHIPLKNWIITKNMLESYYNLAFWGLRELTCTFPLIHIWWTFHIDILDIESKQ